MTAIHLLNPLRDTHSGSDLRTLRMFEVLREAGHKVQLWSPETPAAEICAKYPVRRLKPGWLSWPSGGTLVIVGVYFRLGHWLRLAHFERIVIIYNTDQPDRLAKALTRAHWSGCQNIEVVHTSAALRERASVPGKILESPVDLSPFLGIQRQLQTQAQPFVAGRVSRDCPKKHHDEDIAVYQQLARQGFHVRILGGTCLQERLGNTENIELLAAGAEPVDQFLKGLDVFYYRTSDTWFEAFGRVIFEAMAAGLPVIASRHGGYATYLCHEQDALLFDTTADALAQLQALSLDPGRRCQLGYNARLSAQRICGADLSARMLTLLAAPPIPARHTPAENAEGTCSSHNEKSRGKLKSA